MAHSIKKTRPSLKVFLSHSYNSPDVNLYFFELFKEIANIQFEVDRGNKVTNVTRLERMVKSADAFIGIYPCIETGNQLTYEELVNQSRYFRLEIDLAIRSQKPVIVFYDERFKNIIKLPFSSAFSFNAREVISSGGKPRLERHRMWFEDFCEVVKRNKDYEDKLSKQNREVIGIFTENENYPKESINIIKDVLASSNFSNINIVEAPFILNNKLLCLLENLEMAVVDVGGSIALSGLPAYLHGRFIPMIRLRRLQDNMQSYDFLYGGVEVGYKKDIVEWNDNDSLKNGLEERLKIITREVTLINTPEDAIKYFKEASISEKEIFLSYSGGDLDTGANWVTSLKKYFKKIFDYKDKESIELGNPWMQEVGKSIQKAKIGICLLTQTYVESDYCLQEAQLLVQQSYKKTLKLFIVKLNQHVETPVFLSHMHYIRAWNYKDINEMIEEIVKDTKSTI